MIIYKYLPFDSALKTLSNSSVLLRCPLEYNDPFDCLINISAKENRKALNLFANYVCFTTLYNFLLTEKGKIEKNKMLAKLTISNFQFIEKDIKKTGKYRFSKFANIFYLFSKIYQKEKKEELQKDFDKVVADALSEIRSKTLVSCFSLSFDSILMWSHYGDKHRGVCLKYEIEDGNFSKVKYFKKPVNIKLTKILEIYLGHQFLNRKIDYSNADYKFVIEPLLSKFIDWSYEKEIRCIFSKNVKNENVSDAENGTKLLKMPIVKEIIFGCNASEDDIKTIAEKYGSIPIKKMRNLNSIYGLKEEPIK